MAVLVGSPVPDVELRILEDGAPKPVSSGELLGSGKVVLFAVPGAFTPGCSNTHLPGFVQQYEELRAKGVEKVVCVSVNDAWVMDAWKNASEARDSAIVMAADGNGEFAKAMGLEMDGSGFGLGARSQRYAAIIEDGTVSSLEVEPGGGIDVSSCSSVLNRL
ncbi:MAG TPA: peroxiredoxin [Acidimicrobiaceae bacterium]|nr:peroxiredoxin [Acidimicrobiaceae bacterium]HCB37921.1 peroxiredoxin [Acidimicrobiaceae bacterium]